MTDDRLSYLLDVWREWIRQTDHRHELGYPSTAAGIRYRGGTDFETMTDSMDQTHALAVDAAIDSLEPLERRAVHHVLIRSQWASSIPLQDVFARAREMLKITLHRRGIE